jgi:hypothetical protein
MAILKKWMLIYRHPFLFIYWVSNGKQAAEKDQKCSNAAK